MASNSGNDLPPDSTAPGSSFDPNRATPASTYAALRDSKDVLRAARDSADTLASDIQHLREIVRENASALVRAVRHTAKLGYTRFADLGGGMPASSHDATRLPDLAVVAAGHAPDRRWLLIDSDVVAIMHGRATIGRLPGVEVADPLDLRDTKRLMKALHEQLGLDEPTVVILGAVLHFLDDAEADHLMWALYDVLPADSLALVTHVTSDGLDEETVTRWAGLYEAHNHVPIHVRSKTEVTRLAGRFDLQPPGVVRTPDFLPDPEGPAPVEAPHFLMFMAKRPS
ncbi:SAM-dependent methyltransferase [Nonomuraea wenchangensis]